MVTLAALPGRPHWGCLPGPEGIGMSLIPDSTSDRKRLSPSTGFPAGPGDFDLEYAISLHILTSFLAKHSHPPLLSEPGADLGGV